MSSLRILLAIAALVSAVELGAQTRLTEHTLRRDPGAPAVAGRLDDLAFLEGHWQGDAFGGVVEEIWAPALGGSMLGAFKLVGADGIEFQEIMNLGPDSAAGLSLRVKHFDAEMSAWEEKEEMVRFAFIRAVAMTAWFNGLTFERDGDRLTIHLALRQEDGSTNEVEMRLYRFGSDDHAAWRRAAVTRH